jgi:hypothetical protein
MKVRVTGIPELTAYIKTLARGMKVTGMRAVAEWMLGDDTRGLRHYPKRVQHGENNPYQWQSDKQRKAYFATNGFGGGIPSTRTDTLKNAWDFKETNSQWDRVAMTNSTPYARYVQGAQIQRGHIADKWRQALDVMRSNIKGAIRHAQAEVNKLIARRR